jgi:uncharacterized protein YkwD
MSHTPQATRIPTARRRLVGAAAALVAVVALAGCWSNNQQSDMNLINSSRKSSGLRSLNGDSLAMDKAQAWSDYMARTGVLQHTGGGSKLSTSGLGRWCAVAENVGYGSSLSQVHNAFLASGSHRANMLGNYDRVGTGVTYRNGLVWVTEIYLRGTC